MDRPWFYFLPPGCVRPFRDREVDPKKPVEVYRNLQRGGYSVRQSGHVVAHVDAIMLKDVTFVVQAAGWKRALRERRRNVHAWVRGYVTDSGMGTTPVEADLRRIRYNLQLGIFQHELTSLPPRQRKLNGAMVVALNEHGACGAYFR